jgi:hypothetical protein
MGEHIYPILDTCQRQEHEGAAASGAWRQLRTARERGRSPKPRVGGATEEVA